MVFLFCVFMGILFPVGPPGGAIVLFLVFTGRARQLATSGGRYFFTIHSSLFTQLTPFGDSIFLLVKKDRGERHAKGLQSRPLESCFYTGVRRGDVRASYEFARVQLTRFRPVRGVLRTASTDSCVLHVVRRNRNIYRITGLICGRKLGGCISLQSFPSHCEPVRTLVWQSAPPVACWMTTAYKRLPRRTSAPRNDPVGCVSLYLSTAPQHAEARG